MSQSIENPIGLNVFGSALLRVAPDVASVNLSVATTQKKPRAAFEETRKSARAVREYLSNASVDDVLIGCVVPKVTLFANRKSTMKVRCLRSIPDQ